MVRLIATLLIVAACNVKAQQVSFRNDVMAVLAKAGCNAGTCHGNKNGKGGFKLSLRGQDPDQDWLTLARDLQGRRINPIDPGQSLILLKPTTQIAHEGGQRFNISSDEYETLRRWIAEGNRDDVASAPTLERITVAPTERVLTAPENSVQLQVRAYFSDGSERDVTRIAVYDTSNGTAKVDPGGLVQRIEWGEVTVLVRFLQAQQPVRLAFIPARAQFAWADPPANNYIDDYVFAKLRRLRLNPSRLCSDTVFLRRAYLDTVGLLPTAEQARTFAIDPRPDKRSSLVENLLQRPEFADNWALKWADLLRNEAHSLDQKGVHNFHRWIRESIAQNKPLDVFARELITARGSTYSSPAANYYRPNRDPVSRARAAAQVFLGTRLQCAECHNHPFDRWTQDDYYDWAGLFAQIKYKVLQNDREISSDQHEWNGEQVVFISKKGTLQNPRTGQSARPRFLGETAALNEGGDYLLALGRWATSPQNPFFGRTQANRIWFHLMGRGLVDPVDDFRATNPPSHPELIEALAEDFARHRFDLRYLIGTIMSSRAYQLDSEPDETNNGDELNYSHALVRRLSAEQLLDCQSQVCGVPLKFGGYPAGLRAGQLPGVRPEAKGKRRANTLDQFLEMFGKPPRLVSSESERSCECNLGQALQMFSGPTVNELLSAKDNRLAQWIASGRSNREIIDELFWTAFSRAPEPTEMEPLLQGLVKAADRRAELEDIVWGLLSSSEFVFRR
jgi:hypothetical protein